MTQSHIAIFLLPLMRPFHKNSHWLEPGYSIRADYKYAVLQLRVALTSHFKSGLGKTVSNIRSVRIQLIMRELWEVSPISILTLWKADVQDETYASDD